MSTPAKGGVLLRKSLLQRLLAPLVWVAAVVTAVARPQLVEPPIEKIESARDLMLAVDLSGSMETRDMFDADGERINRLDMVKLVLDDFIARRDGDRIGVIVFGDQAFLQAPFTQDHDLVRTLLDQVEPGMPGPQTMLGDAIGLDDQGVRCERCARPRARAPHRRKRHGQSSAPEEGGRDRGRQRHHHPHRRGRGF